MKVLAPALLLLISIASRPCAEEPTLEQLKEKLQKSWEPWKGCEPGSWVQMKTSSINATNRTETEYRQTLVSRDETGTTTEMRTVKRSKDSEGRDVVELGEPQTSRMPVAAQAGGYEEFKDLRHEEIVVLGRKLDCRVVEATYVYKYPQPVNGQTEIRTKVTMWISPEIQEMGGIVKTEADTDNKVAGMGMGSSDMTLLETGKEVKVGDRTVKCSVYRYGNSTGKEEMTSSGELFMSSEIPMGYAKMRTVMNYKAGNAMVRSEYEVEVTGMEIVEPKTE
ncbi:MAG: hypothetical protein AAB074_15975 [Planctomycetota bacterium]